MISCFVPDFSHTCKAILIFSDTYEPRALLLIGRFIKLCDLSTNQEVGGSNP